MPSMETAPRDRDILVWESRGDYWRVARWDRNIAAPDGGWFIFMRDWGGGCFMTEPTHWQELPDRPTS
jgi:hypothetical protein